MRVIYIVLGILTVVLILIGLAGIYFTAASYRQIQNSLMQEIRETQAEIDRLSRNFTLMAEENNELRRILRQPEIAYELQSNRRSSLDMDDMRGSNNRLAYFHAVEHLANLIENNEKSNESLLTPNRTVQRIDNSNLDDFLIEQNLGELEELFNDSGFVAYLRTMNLILSREPNEDSEFVFFDFFNLEGTRVGSIGIQKGAGGIYLLDEQYVPLGAIQTFGMGLGDNSPDSIPDFDMLPVGPSERGSSLNVLIVGTNQQLTDTLILAMAHEDTQTVDLISLPRDLFFGGRKINEYYYNYGPRRLVREMEAMTGFDIDHYIIIDMYAFIDVIDILGGVEITLNAPLVDPTYRVRDGGQWSTLFYPAGTHQLNGIEALRVSRSRHFISDFGRSRHQQLILSSIIDQVTALGISDIRRVHELAMVFMRYVETDFTPADIVRNIVRFRSISVENRAVFDTNTILYATYANLLRQGLRADQVDESFNLGQYILLPINDDWSLIHRFILSAIQVPGEEY
ncbi:MAG: LCP family protein [Treponema sp.]|nr:LCP family protein [Treponema sp.]